MEQLQTAVQAEERGRWQPQILLMEDEVNMVKGLQMILHEVGCDVDVAMTGRGALEKFGKKFFDLLVADLRLPDIDGMEVIKTVKEKRPETEAIIITGYPSVSSAVAAVKLGVYEYLRKPFTEDEFKVAVAGALKKKEEKSIEALLIQAETERLIQRKEVTRVLSRASEDHSFWRELMNKGSNALQDYQLSMEAKAAIVSGDLKWIKKNIGELTREQLMFIYKTLERESW
jgi:YesN/AraC family two-component response regulator